MPYLFDGTVYKRIVILGDQYDSDMKYLAAVAKIEIQKFLVITLIKKKGRPIRDPYMHILEEASALFYLYLSANIPPPIELVSPPKNNMLAIIIPNSDLNLGKFYK